MNRRIFPTKDHVKDVEVGQIIGIGYPYIHLVCEVMEEGRLKFIYHYEKERLKC